MEIWNMKYEILNIKFNFIKFEMQKKAKINISLNFIFLLKTLLVSIAYQKLYK